MRARRISGGRCTSRSGSRGSALTAASFSASVSRRSACARTITPPPSEVIRPPSNPAQNLLFIFSSCWQTAGRLGLAGLAGLVGDRKLGLPALLHPTVWHLPFGRLELSHRQVYRCARPNIVTSERRLAVAASTRGYQVRVRRMETQLGRGKCRELPSY